MKVIDIQFTNIQSHEQTRFQLKPGLNFILADDNNVGKSTIFKVFTEIAKAPNNKASKLDRLVRGGCMQASAAFRFEGTSGLETVVAWFTRTAPGNSKLFFEYTTADGVSTRAIQCPPSLLKALDIVVGEGDVILNLNDADSVQIVAKQSAETDSIITRVMTDERVEHVKYNIGALYKDVALDYRLIENQLSDAEALQTRLRYTESVDQFLEDYENLEVLAKISDLLVSTPEITAKDKREGVVSTEQLGKIITVTEAMPCIPDKCDNSKLYALSNIFDVARELQIVDTGPLQRKVVTEEQIAELGKLVELINKLRSAYGPLKTLETTKAQIAKSRLEEEELLDIIKANSRRVVCPIQGEVYYTDDKCVPCGN